DVEVLAVTKGHPATLVVAAKQAGLTAIGENYAQELVSKFAALAREDVEGLAVHFIGQLQTNKVRHLVDLVDVYETVDRPAIVVELAKRAPGARVLIQVNTTGEASKGGCSPDLVESLVAQARSAGL